MKATNERMINVHNECIMKETRWKTRVTPMTVQPASLHEIWENQSLVHSVFDSVAFVVHAISYKSFDVITFIHVENKCIFM